MKLFLPLCFFILIACQSEAPHFMTDTAYREQVQQQFKLRKETVHRKSLFSVFDKPDLTLMQREALEFLYAYMPLSDLADYDGLFYLQQVNAAFAARDSFAWGKTIPEDIFRHFVLVHRINNENLDTARMVFFNELKDRIKNMSMQDAALEVNHWCHEKANYRGTDGRTSSPLALVKTAWGRCGEESTFTTAAMRAVGIPARQCYTPRWAHTDDNHAWVEVWIDGKWHYIGACEPEPELDAAWFTAPAKRAMMVHTNVFGLYKGPEEKNLETSLYSKINLLANYTDTRQVKVRIVDAAGKAVSGAKVQFKVYNYAEFYTIAEVVSAADGTASVLSGKGDLMIWANDHQIPINYGYGKAGVNDSIVTIKLDKLANQALAYTETQEINVPKEQKVKEISAEKIAENTKRLATEDGIRNAYMSTFTQQTDAISLATSMGLDGVAVWKYLQLAQGNHQEIQTFMEANRTNPDLFPFLASLSIKDLRDTPAAYLNDHLNNGRANGIKKGTPDDLVAQYILSPRIALELIRPWRTYFHKQFDAQTAAQAQEHVAEIIKYVKQEIKINETDNYYLCPISPQGVYELRVADSHSRNIFFVALCRSAGIAARIEQATNMPQYYENNQWVNAVFDAPEASNTSDISKAHLVLENAKSNLVKPEYYKHYTIARFTGRDFESLDFEGDPRLQNLPAQLDLAPGYYQLMIGTRANDGSVTVANTFFELKADERKTMTIEMPKVEGKLQVRGIIDMNTKVTLADHTTKTLKDLSKGKGVFLCFADPDKEPTKHILQDLPSQEAKLNEWGGGILFLVPDDKLSAAFKPNVFPNLPQQTLWGVDQNRVLLNEISQTLRLDFRNNFPLTLFISNSGGILFVSEGYRIGIGENIVLTIGF